MEIAADLEAQRQTAADSPVMEIADAQQVPFPGFDRLVLEHDQLQWIKREHRYKSGCTAVSLLVGVYLITNALAQDLRTVLRREVDQSRPPA